MALMRCGRWMVPLLVLVACARGRPAGPSPTAGGLTPSSTAASSGALADGAAQHPGGVSANRCLPANPRFDFHLRLRRQWRRSTDYQWRSRTGLAQRRMARLSRAAAGHGCTLPAGSTDLDRFRLANVRGSPDDRSIDTASRGFRVGRLAVARPSRSPLAAPRRIPHAFGSRH